MKFIQILGHPIVLASSFCLLLISGEHLGGFYLLYILLGLPFFAAHSLLGAMAIVFVLLRTNAKLLKKNSISVTTSLTGAALMVSSIVVFFYSDKTGYNEGTFHQTVPILSFILFAFLLLCYLTRLFWQQNVPINKNGKVLKA